MKWLENIIDKSIGNIDEISVLNNISNKDITDLEKTIGYKLPESYKYFLQYKYSHKLKLDDISIQLFLPTPTERLNKIKESIFEYHEPEEIIGKGYIYFADFHDYGLLCFNANEKMKDNEYKIVYIDHEDSEEIHPYAQNFRELLENDKESGNRFVEYLNKYHE
ncbi:MAG: hypothetical protein ACJAWV_003915 [Flammeovirgaceae bacterium]|jgi:hypothetical protein